MLKCIHIYMSPSKQLQVIEKNIQLITVLMMGLRCKNKVTKLAPNYIGHWFNLKAI